MHPISTSHRLCAGVMHANEATIHRFYTAFVESDVDTMIACYAPDAHFSDSMFPNLHGKQLFAMWSFLIAGKPYVVVLSCGACLLYGLGADQPISLL